MKQCFNKIFYAIFFCTISTNALADAVSFTQYCFPNHPFDFETRGNGYLTDTDGPIKTIIETRKYKNEVTQTQFNFDINKKILRSIENNHLILDFEYDDRGRIKQILHKRIENKNEKTYEVEKYKYIDEKNLIMVSAFSQPKNKWEGMTAIMIEKNSSSQICFQMDTDKYKSSGKRYSISSDGLKYTIQGRDTADSKHMFAVSVTEKEAEIQLLTVLNDLRSFKGTECNFENANDNTNWDCNYFTKSQEGDYIKIIESHDLGIVSGSHIEKPLNIAWYYKNGLQSENVNLGDMKMSNGKIPHRLYKYDLDDYGNWKAKSQYIQTPPTLIDDKTGLELENSITRKISYY